MAGQPVRISLSSSPQLSSMAAPSGWITCVEIVSLGKVARSTSSTRQPLRASSMAVGEPAQRAPTTIASKFLGIAILQRGVAARNVAPRASLGRTRPAGNALFRRGKQCDDRAWIGCRR